MTIIRNIITALWQHDFIALTDPHIANVVYCIMFAMLFLENGLLPASFLPGDSLLLLAGALIDKGVICFTPTILILTVAAGLGCWLSYLQGRWLSNTRIIKYWLTQLPCKYHQRATYMFDRHGLFALLTGRFFVFIRTLLPIIAGISCLSDCRFQIFNWLSAFLWVSTFISLGYMLNMIPFIKHHEEQVMTLLLLLPIILLIIGIFGILMIIIKRKKYRHARTSMR